jgi:hypothetical protein
MGASLCIAHRAELPYALVAQVATNLEQIAVESPCCTVTCLQFAREVADVTRAN